MKTLSTLPGIPNGFYLYEDLTGRAPPRLCEVVGFCPELMRVYFTGDDPLSRDPVVLLAELRGKFHPLPWMGGPARDAP